MATCANPKCGREFEPPAPKRSPWRPRGTCSRSCQVALGWLRGNKEARLQAMRDDPRRREAALAWNAERWSRQGERERLAELNRERWADAGYRARLSKILRERCRTPEYRATASAMSRAAWRDPVIRERLLRPLRDPARRARRRHSASEPLPAPAVPSIRQVVATRQVVAERPRARSVFDLKPRPTESRQVAWRRFDMI